jgi:hypothetical protein
VVIAMGCGDACSFYSGNAMRTGSLRIPPARVSSRVVDRVRYEPTGRLPTSPVSRPESRAPGLLRTGTR